MPRQGDKSLTVDDAIAASERGIAYFRKKHMRHLVLAFRDGKGKVFLLEPLKRNAMWCHERRLVEEEVRAAWPSELGGEGWRPV